MITHLDHVNIVVADMDRSVAFYRDVIGMEQAFETTLEGEWVETIIGLRDVKARCVFLKAPDGGTHLELLQFLSPTGTTVDCNAVPNTIGVRHLAFRVRDLTAFATRLRDAGVEPVSPPVTVPFPVADAGEKRLCYFRDPDGVLLEAAEYRAGTGRSGSR